MIKSIYLSNFTCFGESEFHFRPGINLIRGLNGSGKSSIVNALSVAMFNQNDRQLNSYIKRGKKHCKIVVEFEYGGFSMRIEREFGRKSSVILIKDGKPYESGVANTYDTLSKLLGINGSQFSKILYINPGNITAPFLGSQSSVEAYFNDVFDILKWYDIYSELRHPNKIIKDRVDNLNMELVVVKDRLSYLEKLKSDIETAKAVYDRLIEEEYVPWQENRENHERWSALSNQIKDSKERLRRIIADFSSAKKRLEALDNSVCVECGQPILVEEDVISDLKKIIRTKEEDMKHEGDFLSWAREEIDAIGEIKNISDPTPTIKSTKDHIARLEEELNSDRFSNLKEEYERINKEIGIYKEKARILSFIRDNIKNIPSIIINDRTTDISRIASIDLSRMFDRPVDLTMNNKYQVTVDDLHFSQLSEGQRVMSALAIRMAIVKILTEFNVTFLDEPTVSLDANSRELLANGLEDSNMIQTFIITHDDTFINRASCIIDL